jgi:hypothetical protein
MRLSLWQQFSSNHSGSFAVVGRFATEEEAKVAAEKLAEIVRRIDEWFENPPNEAAYQNDSDALTHVEEVIRKEYVSNGWDYQGIEWYGQHGPIHQIGRDIYFCVIETWGTPEPISSLLAKLGGQSYEQLEFDAPITTVVIRLTCEFADAQTAEQVTTHIEDWMDSMYDAHNWPVFTDVQVSQDAARLNLEIEHGVEVMPRLLEWLRSQGARELKYSFEQQTRSEG